MPQKRPSLAESMKAIKSSPSGDTSRIQAPETAAAKSYFAPSRAGKRRLTLIVEPSDDHRRLKHLSADTDRSMEDLLREALADFLRKHNA
jgi:hypothetical protein